jgi:hypothetical protein
MNPRKIGIILLAPILALGVLTACSSDADVASHNLGKDAENFKILRRIVFINGITDQYLLEITGYCSVETTESALGGSLEVTCKTGPDEYKKHFLGLSDNVSYLVEQIEGQNVSTDTYTVIFKPSVIVPNFEKQ